MSPAHHEPGIGGPSTSESARRLPLLPQRSPDFWLELEAASHNVGVFRSLAASAGIRAGLSIDAVIDAKIATDEVTQTLIAGAAPGARISCSMVIDEDALLVREMVDRTRATSFELSSLGRTIIDATTASFEAASAIHLADAAMHEVCVRFAIPRGSMIGDEARL